MVPCEASMFRNVTCGIVNIQGPLNFNSHHFASKAFLRFRRNTWQICHINASVERMENHIYTKSPSLRLEKVDGHMTELMEWSVANPKFKVIFIPGNPGIVAFYKTYLDTLSRLLNGEASITAISHIGHTARDWHNRKLFSLEEQIQHKVRFIENENTNVPLFLVGHSIGAYIALSAFKELPDKVEHVLGLYPFLAINSSSSFQSLLRWSARQGVLCEAMSYFAGFVGKLPKSMARALVNKLFGRNWSPVSVDVACEYLLQYSLVRNFAYMGMTEFLKLQANPDWDFLREKQNMISLLFGVGDHWGPLSLYEDVSSQVPVLDIQVEREGHDHAFCCTEAGSRWVAGYCAKTIQKLLPVIGVATTG